MIVFKKTNGLVHDLRLVGAEYAPDPDELVMEGDELPVLESLHDAPTAAELGAAKCADINAAFEAAAAQLTAGYPDAEKLSWATQESEALAWRANSAAATSYIDAVASARGLSRTEQLSRVLKKVDAFRTASARLIGTRQKYVDLVDAAALAGDVKAIAALVPLFSLV